MCTFLQDIFWCVFRFWYFYISFLLPFWPIINISEFLNCCLFILDHDSATIKLTRKYTSQQAPPKMGKDSRPAQDTKISNTTSVSNRKCVIFDCCLLVNDCPEYSSSVSVLPVNTPELWVLFRLAISCGWWKEIGNMKGHLQKMQFDVDVRVRQRNGIQEEIFKQCVIFDCCLLVNEKVMVTGTDLN